MMQERENSPEREWGSEEGWALRPCTKREFIAEHRKELKCMPKFESKGNFIREKVMLHKQSVVSPQR